MEEDCFHELHLNNQNFEVTGNFGPRTLHTKLRTNYNRHRNSFSLVVAINKKKKSGTYQNTYGNKPLLLHQFQNFLLFFIYSQDHDVHKTDLFFTMEKEILFLVLCRMNHFLLSIFLSLSYLFPRQKDIRSTSKIFLMNVVSR